MKWRFWNNARLDDHADLENTKPPVSLSAPKPALWPNTSRFAAWTGGLLVVSGVLHLACLFLTNSDWEGATSLRKPALFGISAGLTTWSIDWVFTRLRPHWSDRRLMTLIAASLLVEVGLITMQQWRGMRSHFNHASYLDAAIEAVMLGLILIVTLGIFWISVRLINLPAMGPGLTIAIRGGFWLLAVSCVLGFLITFLGERNQTRGLPPELWGRAGVMKYPHGAALHAIQLLPCLVWILDRFKIFKPERYVTQALGSQVLLLTQAIWQTSRGRARLDLDWVGGTLLVASWLLLIPSIFVIAQTVFWRILRKNQTDGSAWRSS